MTQVPGPRQQPGAFLLFQLTKSVKWSFLSRWGFRTSSLRIGRIASARHPSSCSALLLLSHFRVMRLLASARAPIIDVPASRPSTRAKNQTQDLAYSRLAYAATRGNGWI